MNKRGSLKLIIILAVVVILILVLVSVTFNGDNSTTGNGILDILRNLVGQENPQPVSNINPYGVPSSTNVQIVSNQMIITGLPSTQSAYGAYGAEDVSLVLLKNSCDNGLFIESTTVANGQAVFNDATPELGDKYCVVIPGTYSGEYLFRNEFHVTEGLLEKSDEKSVICDPSPLSNEAYYCTSGENLCEFYGADVYEDQETCQVLADELTTKFYMCRPNKFYDYECYNQFDDCVAGIDNVYDGENAYQSCRQDRASKNPDLWYLCYCTPEGVQQKVETEAESGIRNNLITGRRAYILNNYRELEAVRDYNCVQDPKECLACPGSVASLMEAYDSYDGVQLDYCDPSEKDSAHGQFPRAIVSVHENLDSCNSEAQLYECRG